MRVAASLSRTPAPTHLPPQIGWELRQPLAPRIDDANFEKSVMSRAHCRPQFDETEVTKLVLGLRYRNHIGASYSPQFQRCESRLDCARTLRRWRGRNAGIVVGVAVVGAVGRAARRGRVARGAGRRKRRNRRCRVRIDGRRGYRHYYLPCCRLAGGSRGDTQVGSPSPVWDGGHSARHRAKGAASCLR